MSFSFHLSPFSVFYISARKKKKKRQEFKEQKKKLTFALTANQSTLFSPARDSASSRICRLSLHIQFLFLFLSSSFHPLPPLSLSLFRSLSSSFLPSLLLFIFLSPSHSLSPFTRHTFFSFLRRAVWTATTPGWNCIIDTAKFTSVYIWHAIRSHERGCSLFSRTRV